MRNKFQDLATLDLYQNRGKVKWIIFISSLVISVGSIYYTNTLVEELKEREKRQIELYASAMEYVANNSDNLTFIYQGIIQENNNIPVIVADAYGNPTGEHRNIKFKRNATDEDKEEKLRSEIIRMKADYEPIPLYEDQFIYYTNS